jgi:archaellum component FlaC
MSTTLYISIASSVAFVISEILPFIKNTEVNGILHSIQIFINDCKQNQIIDGGIVETLKNDVNNVKIEVNDIKNDIDTIKSGTIENSSGDVIVNIKSDVNDIKNEVNDIKIDVNDIKANIKDIKVMFEHSEIV